MKWINVEERLPDDGKFKLVVCKTVSEIFTTRNPLLGIYLIDQWKCCGTDFGPTPLPINGKITHWSEMPPLPKEENEVD